MRIELMIMSGVEDGLRLSYDVENGDGQLYESGNNWKISVGRREDSDICLRNDTFVSRLHAFIKWEDSQWWLEDCGSTNGTYVENNESDTKVEGTIALEIGKLFRVGHTWMRLEETNT